MEQSTQSRPAERRRGTSARSLPRATTGPYKLDLDRLFEQASANTLARSEISAQLEILQDPPDMTAAIAERRDVLRAGVADLEDRAHKTGNRLHELLVANIAIAGDQIEEFGALVANANTLREAVAAIDEDLPASDGEPDAPAGERLVAWLQRLQPYRRDVEAWLEAQGTRKTRQSPLPLRRSSASPTPPANLPADLVDLISQERVECQRVIAEIEEREMAALLEAVPVAREQLEFRALTTEWESQQREILLTLESAMLSVVLTSLNTALTAATAPRMRVASLDGLRATLTNERVVLTAAFERLDAMIRERRDGSFGVAGPRGVGKTTLIKFFATALGMPGSSADRPERPRVGVVVSAPVEYEARDFVLHLYAELCKRVAGGDADRAIHQQQDSDRSSDRGDLLAEGTRVGMGMFGSGAVTGAVGLLAWTITRRLASPAHPLADVGAGLLTLAAALLLLLGYRAAAAIFSVTVTLVPDELDTAGVKQAQFASRTRRLRANIWYSSAVSVLTVAGSIFFVVGNGWRGGLWPLAVGLALLALGVPMLRAARRLSHHLRFAGLSLTPLISDLETSSDTQLRELALDHLRQIRLQQTFSSERSLTVKISGGSALPAGFDAGLKRGATWAERAKTYPELVADLRAFLTAAAEKYELIIGVDELDKLRSPESVENFLNDIKGIFGASGCFYLVSVSEDAAASFERRGTPFRDVFDSSFDDVISLHHLDLTSARKILYGLLLGWTEPFVAMCYVLSGGLTRDLQRSARDLVSCRDAIAEIELGHAALALCRREGKARLQAVRHELMGDAFDTASIELLNKIADLTLDEATADTFRHWHDDLYGWAAVPAPTTSSPAAATQNADQPGASQTTTAQRTASPARLAFELAAFMQFAATVLDFFDPATIGDRLPAAENPRSGAKSLAMLATARQSLASNPQVSLACTQRFRAAWAL